MEMRNNHMKTKKLIFLLALTFLFLFGCSDSGDEQEVKNKFYPSGKLMQETHYKNGIREGLETSWYETGEKKLKGQFKDGLPHGLWTRWNKDGTKKFSKKQILKKIVLEEELLNEGTDYISEAIESVFGDSLGDSVDFEIASVDLNDDGKDEVIVKVRGRDWCGSGGCTSHILQKSGEDGWKEIGHNFGGYDFTLSSIPENGFLPIYYKHSDNIFRKWSYSND
jgi:hypothetical protein